MKNLIFQKSKTDKLLTNSKTVVPKEYYDFLNIFLKAVSDIIIKYLEYDYKIRLLKSHKSFSYSFFQNILQAQLEFVKKFIKTSSLPYLLPILLAKKPKISI